MLFHNKFIVVGVTGGIAAYKAADLVSTLTKMRAEVQVIMTASAQQFITPLTMQTLSKHPVVTGMFEEPKAWEVQHIALADRADLFVIAPATANFIGKLAAGIADDMLTTTVMATRAPVLIAPAMNTHMYANPVVQENIGRLARLGRLFVGPASGRLACGYDGPGRMSEVPDIVEAVRAALEPRCQKTGPDHGDYTGLKVLVTAGPTREALDPVRFLSNHSTGRMGYAAAGEAAARGAEVILVSGPTGLTPPPGVTYIPVQSALEMYEAVLRHYSTVDLVVKTAAVADYRPKHRAVQKLKKSEADLILELERNPDILAELGKTKQHQVLVGFAAETTDVLRYAAEKIQKKKLDLIVANDVTQEGAGFGTETNIVRFVFPDGKVRSLPLLTKAEVAREILDTVLTVIRERKKG